MRLLNYLPGFTLLLFMFLSLQTFGQRTYVITLNVDTENLTRENMASSEICYFTTDAPVIDANASLEDFTIEVPDGSTIIWEAVSTTNPDDKVDVTLIRREGGPDIFGSDKIHDEGGTVQAVIQGTTPVELFKYKINFKVNRNLIPYHIDPKIKVGT